MKKVVIPIAAVIRFSVRHSQKVFRIAKKCEL